MEVGLNPGVLMEHESNDSAEGSKATAKNGGRWFEPGHTIAEDEQRQSLAQRPEAWGKQP